VGFPLASCWTVDPKTTAKFVEFTTLFNPSRCRGNGPACYAGHIEGLRLDEAMHPLTLLAVGVTASSCRTRTARRCGW
jgi:sulfoxide reductase catalytic subunit YedY